MTQSAKDQFMKALVAATVKENPDTDMYRFDNVVVITIARENEVPFYIADDEIYVLGLTSHAQRTEHRHGSRAMAFLGTLADQFNIALTLNPVPIGKDAPTYEKLFEFYRNNGFEPVPGEGSLMRREPRGSAPSLDQAA